MKRWIAGLVAVVLAVAAYRSIDIGPRPAPWADPLPTFALLNGYASFYARRGGMAVPAWIELWFDTHPPAGSDLVLVDSWHTNKQPWNARLEMEAFDYSREHGLSRAFAPLREAGIRMEPVEAPWTPMRLVGAGAVFVNLVSGDNAALRWSEARTLESFVRHGGGLVMITDHSNCYFHAEMLAPLTSLLGLELPPVTACDRGAGRMLSPKTRAWLRLPVNPGHPVTEGVGRVGLLTAGTITAPGWTTLAATSEDSWADRWDPYRKADSAGFTGNLEREPEEPVGSLPVAVAGEHGRGRVVVFGDQNAWGATMIGYEDNARLFANAFAWVLDRPIPVDSRPPRSVVTLDGGSGCVAHHEEGFRTLQVMSARHAARTGVPDGCTSGRTAARGIVLLPQDAREDLEELLGRVVLAIVDPAAGITAQLAGLVGDGVEVEPGVRVAGTVTMVDRSGMDNRALGGERDDPADGDEARRAAWARAERLLGAVFDRVR